MACEDRTSEFAQVVAEQRQATGDFGAGASGSLQTTTSSSRTHGAQSPFHALAASVSNQLASTYEKLEQLAKLAKSTNMSFDPAEQIESLSTSITTDIAWLKEQLIQLEDAEQQTNRQEGEHSKVIVKSLAYRLHDAKQRFVKLLERRKENLKRNYAKRKQLFGGGGGGSGSSVKRRAMGNPLYSRDTETTSLVAAAARAEQEQGDDVALTMPQMSLVAEQETETRAQAIEHIQHTIVELGQIFDQVSIIVDRHGEFIDRIDDNIDDVEGNVFGAERQIQKYWENLRSGRWLFVKLAAIGIGFALAWLVFLV